jgi:hypothetical protein
MPRVKRNNRRLPFILLTVFCFSLPGFSTGVLPDRFPGGFQRKEEITLYHADDLYEYIDGLAVMYLELGFRLLEHGRYAFGEKEYAVDVYTLGSPLSAFGIFRQRQTSEDRRTHLGAEGTISSYLAVFYKGSFYVEINPLRNGSEDEKILESLARQVDRGIPGDSKLPAEVSIFPRENLVDGSERYADGNLISSSCLGRGLTALYSGKGTDERSRLFFGLPKDAADARSRFERFRSELKEAVPFQTGGAEGVFGKTPYQGMSIICLWRRFFFGATGFASPDGARPLLEALLQNLSRYDREK